MFGTVGHDPLVNDGVDVVHRDQCEKRDGGSKKEKKKAAWKEENRKYQCALPTARKLGKLCFIPLSVRSHTNPCLRAVFVCKAGLWVTAEMHCPYLLVPVGCKLDFQQLTHH